MRGQFAGVWICVAVFCGGVQAEGTFPWEGEAFLSSPEATLRAAAQLPAPEKSGVDILLDETKFEFDASRRVRRTHRRVARLLTKEALDKWSVATAEWSPWHQERPQIQVRVISLDGQAHMLDAGTITETPVEQSGQVFGDRRRLVAPLPAVEVGAVVEWQIATAEHRAFCDEGRLEEHFFLASDPVRSMKLIIDSPEQDPPLHLRVRGIELTPKRSVEDGRIRLEFGPIPVGNGAAIEGFLPSELPLLPHAVVGNGSDWAHMAQYYSKLVDRQIGDASYVDVARGIVGAERSRMAIVQKLLDAVQKRVRYVGVEFGESSIVPHSPDETLKVRYGDCKDQSTVLVALLRSLGHPAHVALLRAGRKEDLLPEVPALNAFDHAIVYVPGDPPLWIDPTVPLLRASEMPLADMGRLALIASPATTDLVRTPEPQSAQNSVIRTRELVLQSEDHGQMRETIEYRGAYENQMRWYYAENKPEDLQRELEQRLKKVYGIDHVAKFDYGDPRDLTTSLRVYYEADNINHGVIRPSCSVTLVPELILDDLPWPLRQVGTRQKPTANSRDAVEAAWKRAAPLQFPTPFVKEMRYRLILPIGFVARKLPDSFSKQFGPASVSASYAKEAENLVVATFRFDSGNGRLSPDEATALRTFLGQLHGANSETWLAAVDLEHTALQDIANGRIREGLVEFQRLLVQHPVDVETRAIYAEALVGAGLGAAARQEARRLTELDSNSSSAWQILGFAQMYDDFGRFMGHGCDPFAAEAALRKAIELDPKFHMARWNLAVALEHGSGPSRYVSGPRLKEAATHYRELRTQEYPMPDLPTNLLWTLAHLDDWQDVVSLTGELQPSLARNAMWVAAMAATANVAAAKMKAVELGGSEQARRDLMLNAVDILNATRRYETSHELAESTISLITDREQQKRFQAYMAAIKNLKRLDQALFPNDDPRRLVQQLYAAAFSGSTAESVSHLFVEEARPDDASAALEFIRMRHVEILRMAIKTHKTSQRMADTASSLELKVDGDADGGFRIDAGNQRWYVVKRNGELRLLSTAFEFSELGREALRRLDSGDDDGARRWLEWATVELPPPTGFFADPFSASPFGTLWHGLKSDHQKIAASVLATSAGRSDEGLRILSEYRESATSKSQLLQIDRVLASAFTMQKDWERLLECAERMQASHKSADEPRRWKLMALKYLNRMEEFREFEDQRISRMKGSARAWEEGSVAASRGNFDLTQKLLRPLADNPSNAANPALFNNLAWNALFLDEVPVATVLRDAIQANERTNYRSSIYLHTLATVHAELSQPIEAHKFLMQAIDARDGKTENVDFYVLGRIAECYGLHDIAAGHYAQVDTDDAVNSTYALARRRLKQLGR